MEEDDGLILNLSASCGKIYKQYGEPTSFGIQTHFEMEMLRKVEEHWCNIEIVLTLLEKKLYIEPWGSQFERVPPSFPPKKGRYIENREPLENDQPFDVKTVL